MTGVQPGITTYPFYSPTVFNPAVGAIYPGLVPTAASPDALTQIQSVSVLYI